MLRRTIIIILAAVLGYQGARGTERRPEWLWGAAEVGFASGYLSEGFMINDKPLLQSILTAAANNLVLSLAANYDLTDDYAPSAPAFTEIAITMAYFFDLEPFTFSAGISEVFYPNTYHVTTSDLGEEHRKSERPSHLLYLFAEQPDLFLTPQLLLNYALGGDSSFYSRFSLAKRTDLAPTVSAELSTGVAWASGNHHALWMSNSESDWRDTSVKMTLAWRLSDNVVLKSSVIYSYLISGRISDLAKTHGYKAPGAAQGLIALGWNF